MAAGFIFCEVAKSRQYGAMIEQLLQNKYFGYIHPNIKYTIT